MSMPPRELINLPTPPRWQERLVRWFSPLRQRWMLVDGQHPPMAPSEPAAETPRITSQPEATRGPYRQEVTV